MQLKVTLVIPSLGGWFRFQVSEASCYLQGFRELEVLAEKAVHPAPNEVPCLFPSSKTRKKVCAYVQCISKYALNSHMCLKTPAYSTAQYSKSPFFLLKLP